MHTVTKVLVVFAAILCVLLAALTMAYSVNADRITGDYRAEVIRRQAADSLAADAVAQAKTESERLNLRLADQASQLTGLQTKINSLESERTQLMAQVAAAQNERDAIRGQTEQALASNNTLALLNKSYADEVNKLRDNELASRKREIELADRLNDLESQREVLESSVRALQEQLAEANRNIQSGGIRTASGESNAPYKPSFAITGRVISTSKDPATSKPVATINVGANDQVRENMQLVISRNGQFLGNFIVTKTDLQWSVGQIDSLGRPVEIREGDIVSTLVSR